MGDLNKIKSIMSNKYEFKGRVLYYKHREFVLYRFKSGSVGAEIGVYAGDFAKRMVSIVKPKELYLIDPWDSEHIFFCFLQNYIHNLKERGTKINAIKSTVEDAYSDNRIESDYFDWVYLDTNHDYESMTRQLVICQNIVKKNGLITGDDYDPPHWPGVVRAVDEYALQNNLDVEIKNRQFIMENKK